MPTIRLLATFGTILTTFTVAATGASDSGLSLGTAFTFEGTLHQDGVSADGLYDFRYELYDGARGGTFLGDVSRPAQLVRGGVFATDLDFGLGVTSGDFWLEIQVRGASDDTFTTLTPRQRLTKGVASTCTVDSDLQVNGRVVISDDGDPLPPLIVPDGLDVEPANAGGLALFGFLFGRNVAIDNNEIMARNNGSTSTLYLNADGGPVVVGGPLDIGWEIVVAEAPGPYGITAECPAGKKVLGGGCLTEDILGGGDFLQNSYPLSDSAWHCIWDDDGHDYIRAYAICANVQ